MPTSFFESVRGIPATVTSKVERKRVELVNQMLLEGKSPYAHIREGGSMGTAPESVTKVDMIARGNEEVVEPTISTRWSLRDRPTPLVKGRGDRPTPASEALTAKLLAEEGPIDQLLIIPKIVPALGNYICSFCGKEVEAMSATHGMGKVRKIGVVEMQEIDGMVVPVEIIKHISAQVVACPDCSLYVGPLHNRCIMCKGLSDEEIKACKYCKGTKQGERSSSGQKWPIGD